MTDKCAYCGKRLKSYMIIFCSPECFRLKNNNITKTRIKNKKLFIKKYGKFNKKCFKCGATDNLHYHHIDGDYLNNNKDNILILCKVCHYKGHKKYAEDNCIKCSCGKVISGNSDKTIKANLKSHHTSKYHLRIMKIWKEKK